MAPIDIVLVTGFLAIMFLLGSGVSRWIKGTDDFYVAGRELPTFMLAATITATNVSMYSFIGQGGKAYESGFGIIWNTWIGNMMLVFSGIFVVPILRRLRVRTVPEFLEMRFNRHIRLLIGMIWTLKLFFYLAVLLTVSTVAAQKITGIANPWLWFFVFALTAMAYSAIGGAWAIALTDGVQFVVMIAGVLVVLPIVMNLVGWMPNLIETLRATGKSEHLKFVTQGQEFNWLFMISMLLLSIKWACVDQAILQRAFGAKDPRTVARAMVISGVITTPFAFLWIFPGLANAALSPAGLPSDEVIPRFMAQNLGPGILGFVLCGLLASNLSVISADINSAATLFTNDVYNKLFTKAAPRHLLTVARCTSIASGVMMILFAYYVVRRFRSVIDANLTAVAIVDMPVFVITIIYGLFSRRTNWQGAVGGYLLGAAAGLGTFFFFSADPDYTKWAKSLAAIGSTLAALIATPLVSRFFPRPQMTLEMTKILQAFKTDEGTSDEEISLVPSSRRGRFGLVLLGLGFAAFLVGIALGSMKSDHADVAAISGMAVFFAGGLIRVYSD